MTVWVVGPGTHAGRQVQQPRCHLLLLFIIYYYILLIISPDTHFTIQ